MALATGNGSWLGGYRVQDWLWASSRSIVLRAVSADSEVSVILKLPPHDAATASREVRLKREHDIMAKIAGPQVPAPVTFERLDGRPALVLPDTGLTPADQLLRGGSVSVYAATGMALGIARALAGLHGWDVVHKDICPANILTDSAGEAVQLIDFDLAEEAVSEDTEALHPDQLEGTLAYMPPEQTGRINRQIDHRSDFYALGATFFELLTGRAPFPEASSLALVHAHLAVAPPAPSSLNDAVPATLDRIVQRLMAKAPEDRYQTAAALARDLESCWRALGRGDPVPAFAPGQDDIPLTLQVPQRLYGRQAERDRLTAAFDTAAAGSRGMALVTGEPGVGKSALVYELYKPVTAQGGFLLSGKFDQLGAERPYSALIQAYRGLLQHLLSEDDERLAAWRDRLSTALGSNAAVLAKVAPEIEAVLGAQPAPPDLDPQAERNRFYYTLSQFLGAIAGPDHPLVIFLDDLQWADKASLELVQALLTSRDISHLLVVGAYRPGAVGDTHPLHDLTAALKGTATAVESCHLAGLAYDDVAALVADSLATTAQASAELAQLAYDKTLGNPFFLEQTLLGWQREKLLWCDPQAGCWRWDAAGIADSKVADNVVDLLVERLAALPGESQTAVALAALLGVRVDLVKLARLAEIEPQTMLARLKPALAEDILHPVGTAYMQARADTPASVAWLRFRHDNVQQAALARLADDTRHQAHDRAGWLLIGMLGDPETDDLLFDALGHINAVAEGYAGTADGLRLAELNLIAGRRAQRAAAYAFAGEFLAHAVTLLGETPWQRAAALTRQITEARAEAALMLGDWETLERLTATILARSAHAVETVTAHKLRIQAETFRGRPDAAVEAALKGLRQLGVTLPGHPNKPRQIAQLIKTQRIFKAGDLEYQVNRDYISQPKIYGAVTLLSQALNAAFYARSDFYFVAVLYLVQLLYRYGNHPAAPLIFGSLAIVFVVLNRPVAELRRAADLAQNLLAQLPEAQSYAGATPVITHYFVDVFDESPQQLMARMDAAASTSRMLGDVQWVGNSYFVKALTQRHFMQSLDDALAQAEESKAKVEEMGQEMTKDLMMPQLQYMHQLRFPSKDFVKFDRTYCDEFELEPKVRQAKSQMGLYVLSVTKIQLAYHANDVETAARWMPLFIETFDSGVQLYERVRRSLLWLGISAAEISQGYRSATVRQRARIRRMLKQFDDLVARSSVAAHFQGDQFLAHGEVALMEGKPLAALRHFDRAAAASERHGYHEITGLARERAALAQAGWGQDRAARDSLRAAAAAFEKLGAYGKLRNLADRYPDVIDPPGSQAHASSSIDDRSSLEETTEGGGAALDLEAVIQATQTIAQEIQPNALMDTLMRTIGQTAGATHGCLLLFDSDAPQQASYLRTRAYFDAHADDQVRLFDDAPPLDDATAPRQLTRYVVRTGQAVARDDPANAGEEGADPYFQHVKPRSLLALPLVNQGRTAGLLYLEHRETAGAFPPSRVRVLSLLSAQMAISIENAKLYSDMEAQVVERTAELERLASTDVQTGAWRRHQFLEEAKRSFDYARRTGAPLAVIMLDIDRFKTINDLYGHEGGDRVLESVSQICLATKRSYDSFGRLGGEEFALLLPDTDGGGAVTVAERLRQRVAETELALTPTAGGRDATDRPKRVWVTLSLGVASLGPEDETIDRVIQRADEALYQAKNGGRDQVQMAGSLEEPRDDERISQDTGPNGAARPL